jgi:hypothetical protein
MGRLLFAFVLASAAALGEQLQKDMPKLAAYRAKALENALRPVEPFSTKSTALWTSDCAAVNLRLSQTDV